jgi:hypothetical protein
VCVCVSVTLTLALPLPPRPGALPLTTSGKVDRAALPTPPPPSARVAPSNSSTEGETTRGLAVGVSSATLRTPLERTVATVWADALDMPTSRPLGPHDHFWELGGTSVTAVAMLRKLETALGEAEGSVAAEVCVCVCVWCVGCDLATLTLTLPLTQVVAVRLCGLHRKPRLRDYATFVRWAAGVAPDASTAAAGALRQWAEGDVGEGAFVS